MKNRLIILLISLTVSLSSHADTCPPADQIDPNRALPDWQVTSSHDSGIDLKQLYFKKAYWLLQFILPIDETEYPMPSPDNWHVLCEYKTCEGDDCQHVYLLSDFEAHKPTAPIWKTTQPNFMDLTQVCEPVAHDPGLCEFYTDTPTS